MLYHGTTVGGLESIRANAASHTLEKKVAYFTADRCYALACCRNRNENFVTMGLHEDGKQHYYERFPDQLKILYSGRKGYLYEVEKAGNLVIHRYSEIDPDEQKMHANYIKEHINEEGEEMRQFYLAHFSALWS